MRSVLGLAGAAFLVYSAVRLRVSLSPTAFSWSLQSLVHTSQSALCLMQPGDGDRKQQGGRPWQRMGSLPKCATLARHCQGPGLVVVPQLVL